VKPPKEHVFLKDRVVFCVGYFKGKYSPYLVTDYNNYIFVENIELYKENKKSRVIVNGKVICEVDGPVVVSVEEK
jgi:ribosomal protein L24